MKTLILAGLMLSSQVFAQDSKTVLDCSIKGLLPASPEQFRIGDQVRIDLSYIETTKNVFSNELSEVSVSGIKVSGNVRYTKWGGAFPYAFEIVSNNRLLMIVEVSNSGKSARLRSTHLSKPKSGIPVIANLSCVRQ